MNFKNKTVIVTGASSGIGVAISKKFIGHGANVIAIQRRQSPVERSFIQANLSDPMQCDSTITQAIDLFGQLDVLINNAWIMYHSSIEEMTLKSWEKTLQVNLTAPFLLIKYALPFLKKAQGNIINIGSIEGLAANPKHRAYCDPKQDCMELTRLVAVTTVKTIFDVIQSLQDGLIPD